jgi:hydrogenase maturation factor
MADSNPGDAVTASTHCDPVCITCSDQGVTARVIELLRDGTAKVDTGSAVEEVSVELVDAAAGDIVLIHAKVAIAKLTHTP